MIGTAHFHSGSWGIAIVLLFVVIFLHNKGNEKGKKSVTMILRLFYLLIIGSGLFLGVQAFSSQPLNYTLKFILGIVVIGFMEMILARLNKNKKTGVFWLLFIVSLIITASLGYALPLGYHFF